MAKQQGLLGGDEVEGSGEQPLQIAGARGKGGLDVATALREPPEETLPPGQRGPSDQRLLLDEERKAGDRVGREEA